MISGKNAHVKYFACLRSKMLLTYLVYHWKKSIGVVLKYLQTTFYVKELKKMRVGIVGILYNESKGLYTSLKEASPKGSSYHIPFLRKLNVRFVLVFIQLYWLAANKQTI